MIQEDFLRSIHIESDLKHPERLEHYRPTAKSLQVAQLVAGMGRHERATLVIAAYGSGKSLAAAIGGLAVDNRALNDRQWRDLLRKIKPIAPDFCSQIAQRRNNRLNGLVIPLHGYVPDLPAELCRRAGLPVVKELGQALAAMATKAESDGQDRISIIWDEFGRHLESLVAAGRGSDIIFVQQLAEWVARQKSPEATFTALLHQNLLSYATRLNQTTRSTWKKVEGRFEVIRFVEDSREIYRLIADLVADSRPQDKTPASTSMVATASQAMRLGWFSTFHSAEALAECLARAYPLAPAAFYLLPSLASRIAQNERTLFSFLNHIDLRRRVGLAELYGYFSEAMRSDAGVGGSQRRWVETETALSRARDELEREILISCCLLNLGSDGERRRLTKEALVFAVVGNGNALEEVERAIERLVERKLLLYRLRNDDISVWHGPDVDLRMLVEQEKAKLALEFDLATFLTRECPPPFVRPLRHNVERAISRYFDGQYVDVRELLTTKLDHPALHVAPREDGRIVYVLAEDAEAIEDVTSLARTELASLPQTVLVLPRKPLDLTDAALELAGLMRLRENQELTSSDPLVRPEIDELVAIAREHLVRNLDQLTDPTLGGASWICGGVDLRVGESVPAPEALSRLAEKVFDKTPFIANEQLVRQHVSRQMVNARKKCMLAILERSGQEALGFAGETSADASVFKMVLARTGLYVQQGDVWIWAVPEDIRDEGLSIVWGRLRSYFQTPAPQPKPFDELVGELVQPPFGLRIGVLPVLVAAAMRAFARLIAIRRDGVYLTDVLPTAIEAMCQAPSHYTVEVLPADEDVLAYLVGIREEFGLAQWDVETDLIRGCYDAIEAWRRQLPEAALTSRSLGKEVERFQSALRTTRDPVDLLFRAFPELAGSESVGPDVVARIGALRRRVESIVEGYVSEAVEVVRRVFALGPIEDRNILELASAWSACFTEDVAGVGLDAPSRALLSRARDAMNGRYTEASFVRALSVMLLGRDFEQWSDTTRRDFEAALHQRVSTIERAALQVDRPSAAVAPLLTQRVASLVEKLAQAIGADATDELLDTLKRASR